MASVNKVIIVGRLGKDPEVKYTGSGEAIANFSVATSDQWNDKASGEKKESTEWHSVSFFGRIAEVCGKYLKKGSLVYVEGKLKTRKWQDNDGNDRYTTGIVGEKMNMLGGRGSDAGGGDSGEPPAAPAGPAPSPAPQQRSAQGAQRSTNDFEDDIPFAFIGRGIGGHSL